LTGSGFRLRRFTVADYRPASATVEEVETARWVNGMPVPDADKMVRLCERERRKGAMLDLVIADAGDDSYLGEILLFAHEHNCGEIAYVITSAARGRGIATEAVRLLTNWAFASLEFARMQLKINPNNVASIRVAEKAGFTREGLLRSAVDIRGNRADVFVYSRLPDD
jgi:RimJ/RimL family protein N-acetyltransferase